MTTNEIQEAVNLLRDENLIWSSDMNDIRRELAELLIVAQSNPMFRSFAVVLAHKLLNGGGEPGIRFDDIERR
jgi:hypothetical protein